MNDIGTITPAVETLRKAHVPFALMHGALLYPTPYVKRRLGALEELAEHFPDAVVGLSDHASGNYTCFAAVALGASLLEKHYASDETWPGLNILISVDPMELKDLIQGFQAIHAALGGSNGLLPEEEPTICFADACIVAAWDIVPREELTGRYM